MFKTEEELIYRLQNYEKTTLINTSSQGEECKV